MTYPTIGKGKSSTQTCLGKGHVSSLEGTWSALNKNGTISPYIRVYNLQVFSPVSGKSRENLPGIKNHRRESTNMAKMLLMLHHVYT